jgi:hypothetical protein
MTERRGRSRKSTLDAPVTDPAAYLLVKEHGFAAPVVVAEEIGNSVQAGNMKAAKGLLQLLRNINNMLSGKVD